EIDVIGPRIGQRAVAVATQVRKNDMVLLGQLPCDLVPAGVVFGIATPRRRIETWSRARPWARLCSRCERSNPPALSAIPGTRVLGRLLILPGRANPTGWNFWKPQVGALLTARAVL